MVQSAVVFGAEGAMRGTDKRSGELFSYVDLEKRVRPDHPLRPIQEMANAALAIKTVAGMRKTKLRGLANVDWAFAFTAAAYNLVRLPKLLAVSP